MQTLIAMLRKNGDTNVKTMRNVISYSSSSDCGPYDCIDAPGDCTPNCGGFESD